MLLRNWINSCSGNLTGSSNGNNRWKDTQGRITQYGMFGDTNSTDEQNINCNSYKEEDYGSTSGSYSPQYMERAIVGVLDSVRISTTRVNSGQTFDTYSHLTWTQTVTNNTSDSVTVTEIGLFGRLSSAVTQSKPCMLYTRDIISPVTIAPGETKTFVVTIDLTQMALSASAS